VIRESERGIGEHLISSCVNILSERADFEQNSSDGDGGDGK